MREFQFDLLVIGSGPAGQRAAIQAAKLDKRVVLVEKKSVVGGACINTGTIPSKTLREAVLYLSGYRERSLYGASYSVKQNTTMQDLLFRTENVIRHEIDVTRHQLLRNRVEMLEGSASFVDANTVKLEYAHGQGHSIVGAYKIVIATGSEATRDPHIPFDGQRIFICDDILDLKHLPRSLTIVGAGIIGCEYASLFAALGIRVTLIDKRATLLPFVDHEIVDVLAHNLRENRVTFRFGEEVSSIEQIVNEYGPRVLITLASGKQIVTEKALYCIGRTGATQTLNLPAAGLAPNNRGQLAVNEHFQTAVPHIYAVGDVTGFPSLASTSMEQGRLATCHAFGVTTKGVPLLFPHGIYTIPEISFVGRTEQELTANAIPYELGKAHYHDNARGQIRGGGNGLLKLLFHSKTRELLGIHILGEGASELIHIGQAVMAYSGTIDHFVETVFNYPTLAECYKTAAFDGINRLAM